MDTNSPEAGAPKAAPKPRKPRVAKPKPIETEGTIRDQVKGVAAQASAKARDAAAQGLNTAGEMLDNVAGAVEDSAKTIDQRFGKTYGDFARKAADAVSDAASNVKGKQVDDLVDMARETVRKRPLMVAGVAAAVGFALTRLFRVGGDEEIEG